MIYSQEFITAFQFVLFIAGGAIVILLAKHFIFGRGEESWIHRDSIFYSSTVLLAVGTVNSPNYASTLKLPFAGDASLQVKTFIVMFIFGLLVGVLYPVVINFRYGLLIALIIHNISALLLTIEVIFAQPGLIWLLLLSFLIFCLTAILSYIRKPFKLFDAVPVLVVALYAAVEIIIFIISPHDIPFSEYLTPSTTAMSIVFILILGWLTGKAPDVVIKIAVLSQFVFEIIFEVLIWFARENGDCTPLVCSPNFIPSIAFLSVSLGLALMFGFWSKLFRV